MLVGLGLSILHLHIGFAVAPDFDYRTESVDEHWDLLTKALNRLKAHSNITGLLSLLFSLFFASFKAALCIPGSMYIYLLLTRYYEESSVTSMICTWITRCK